LTPFEKYIKRIARVEKSLIIKLHKNFEDAAHDNDGVEFWYARELMELFEYDNRRK
jgi:DNA-damage-inducible protein D